jgi:autoinducer 2-degrading protein
MKVITADAVGSRAEQDNLRFDVLADPENRHIFTTYEAYKDQEAFDFHKTTQHFKDYRRLVDSGAVTIRTRQFMNSPDFTF